MDDAPAVSPPAHPRRLPRALVVLAAWGAAGLFESAKALVASRLHGQPVGVWQALVQNMPWWLTWAPLTPAVVAVARRFRVDAEPSTNGRGRAAAVLLAAAVATALVHLTAEGTIYYATTSHGRWVAMLRRPMTLPLQLQLFVDNYLVLDVLTFGAIVGVVYALDYQRRYRESALLSARLGAQAAQLRHRAAEARLQALRMELNPHFLFNTLNAIAGLVRRRDNDVAVTMLARLGDLLRATLERGAATEMPLRDELALLEHYLEIERVRFAGRLTVEVTRDDGTDDALVPALILQPLVENAIRHGIARRPGPGLVRVSARRSDAQPPLLVLEVRDTGEGLRPRLVGDRSDGRAGAGVGLSNTRARLDELYGAQAGLALEGAEGGGARARIWLPLHTAPAASAGALGA